MDNQQNHNERPAGGEIAEPNLNGLRKQAANEPGHLAVRDERQVRLLAIAGRGGSY